MAEVVGNDWLLVRLVTIAIGAEMTRQYALGASAGVLNTFAIAEAAIAAIRKTEAAKARRTFIPTLFMPASEVEKRLQADLAAITREVARG